MWVPIPITRTKHTAVAEGCVDRLIVCEQCGTEYVYTVEEVAQGESTSFQFMDGSAAQTVARQEAQRALAAQLLYSYYLVPCPSCGFYQAAMVARMRMGHLHWMFRLGVFLRVLLPFFLGASLLAILLVDSSKSPEGWIVTGVLWFVTFLILVTAATLFIVRSRCVKRYNPNDEDVGSRKKMGRRLAMPKDEYLKRLNELRKKRLL